MQYRTLGKTGWQVSAIGMGCWGIGGQWGSVEEATALDTLRRAVDLGVNFFDTADAYGEPIGRSEELVGKALQPIREQVFIATKVGNYARRVGHPLPFTSPYHIVLCCDASLFRLRTDYIDLYQCHLVDLLEPDVFLEAFEMLKQQGKIRAYGISTNALPVLERFNQDEKCDTLQFDYSILNRSPEKDLLPYCQAHDIGAIARGSLAMGILTGKFGAQTEFTDSVRAGWNEGRGREQYLERIRRTEALRFLETGERTLAQGALQYVLAHPAVSCTIPGAKSVAQIEANAKAGDGELSADEVTRVHEVSADW